MSQTNENTSTLLSLATEAQGATSGSFLDLVQESPTAPARGRPRMEDPTDPEQIRAITTRCKAHYVVNNGVPAPLTRKAAGEHAKRLKSLGNPIEAKVETDGDGSEVLFFF